MTEYDPNLLSDPQWPCGRHKRVLIFASYVVSVHCLLASLLFVMEVGCHRWLFAVSHSLDRGCRRENLSEVLIPLFVALNPPGDFLHQLSGKCANFVLKKVEFPTQLALIFIKIVNSKETNTEWIYFSLTFKTSFCLTTKRSILSNIKLIIKCIQLSAKKFTQVHCVPLPAFNQCQRRVEMSS